MPHEIAGITECLLCGRRFAGPQAIVLGQSRTISLLEKLALHIQQAHSDQYKAIDVLKDQYGGMLNMLNFKTSDPNMKTEVDRLRWAIHQQTIAARIHNEAIANMSHDLALTVVEVAFSEFNREAVARESGTLESLGSALTPKLVELVKAKLSEVLTDMRDVMQEPNKYPSNMLGRPARQTVEGDSSLIKH